MITEDDIVKNYVRLLCTERNDESQPYGIAEIKVSPIRNKVFTNVALGKRITKVSGEVEGGNGDFYLNPTDGVTDVITSWIGNKGSDPQYYDLDLGASYHLGKLEIWRFHFNGGRTYRNCVIMLSDDPNFPADQTTIVYNNDTDNSLGFGAGEDEEYKETAAGKEIIIDKPVSARYIRLYSQGSYEFPNGNELVEVKAYES